MPQRLEVILPRARNCAALARRVVERAFAREIDDVQIADLKLVVTELVDNAFVHGRGEITMRLGRDGDLVRVEVIDEGHDAMIKIRERADLAGGHGLRLVDEVAAAWGALKGTTHVWAIVPVG
jgi:anti-sigma regulatory factor (Ser/Thr protein kinase)